MGKPLKSLKRAAQAILEEVSAFRPVHQEARNVARLERRGSSKDVTPDKRHLDAAISWIKSAQAAAGDCGGVAWGYRARAGVRSGMTLGWAGPYPETTGYIIPTMLRYAASAGDASSADAARRMADWGIRIQLNDGGFQGGIYGSQPVSSSTFVTGQVLFGMLAAYREWRSDSSLDAAVRAGNFLLTCLDENGRFIKGFSPGLSQRYSNKISWLAG